MLVNTIAFYARPMRWWRRRVGQRQRIRGAVVRHDLLLLPSAIINVQSFGTAQVRISRRYLHPTAPVNAQSFGFNQIQLANRTYLGPTAVSNASAFGAHKFKKRVMATAYANASAFGANTIAVAEKKFSYANTLGTGNRTGTITVAWRRLGWRRHGIAACQWVFIERVLVEQRKRRHSYVRLRQREGHQAGALETEQFVHPWHLQVAGLARWDELQRHWRDVYPRWHHRPNPYEPHR